MPCSDYSSILYVVFFLQYYMTLHIAYCIQVRTLPLFSFNDSINTVIFLLCLIQYDDYGYDQAADAGVEYERQYSTSASFIPVSLPSTNYLVNV
jgi:hypothetical protein